MWLYINVSKIDACIKPMPQRRATCFIFGYRRLVNYKTGNHKIDVSHSSSSDSLDLIWSDFASTKDIFHIFQISHINIYILLLNFMRKIRAPFIWDFLRICHPSLWKKGKHMFMMTSSNGNIFRVTGHLCGEFTGPGEFPAQRPVTRSFDVFFHLITGWVNNREAGDLKRHRAHYDVIVMKTLSHCCPFVKGTDR